MNTSLILSLIVACIVLYWIGGERWAHTLFRDAGCSICIFALSVILLDFHWTLLAVIPIAWGGFTIGDHEEWQWAIHAFVVSLCMLPYALLEHTLIQFFAMSIAVTLGTYLTSKFFSNKIMLDVWCRASLFATIPLWFLIK